MARPPLLVLHVGLRTRSARCRAEMAAVVGCCVLLPRTLAAAATWQKRLGCGGHRRLLPPQPWMTKRLVLHAALTSLSLSLLLTTGKHPASAGDSLLVAGAREGGGEEMDGGDGAGASLRLITAVSCRLAVVRERRFLSPGRLSEGSSGGRENGSRKKAAEALEVRLLCRPCLLGLRGGERKKRGREAVESGGKQALSELRLAERGPPCPAPAATLTNVLPSHHCWQ